MKFNIGDKVTIPYGLYDFLGLRIISDDNTVVATNPLTKGYVVKINDGREFIFFEHELSSASESPADTIISKFYQSIEELNAMVNEPYKQYKGKKVLVTIKRVNSVVPDFNSAVFFDLIITSCGYPSLEYHLLKKDGTKSKQTGSYPLTRDSILEIKEIE